MGLLKPKEVSSQRGGRSALAFGQAKYGGGVMRLCMQRLQNSWLAAQRVRNFET